MLTLPANCVISSTTATNQATASEITDAKLYVSVGTLSTQDNSKLLQQLESVFKHLIIRNKYQSRVSTRKRNQSLDYLIDPSFQGVDRVFVLLLENNAYQRSLKRYSFQFQK